MVGKRIRAVREFRGWNQIQLAEKSGINVGTIRKYELGLRNPKPEQLEKIASALGLNVSLFLDLDIQTTGDVLSLLFAINDAVDMNLKQNSDNKTITIEFTNTTLQNFFERWVKFKESYEKSKEAIDKIEDSELQKEKQEELEKIKNDWELTTMTTTLGCNTIVTKGHDDAADGITVRIPPSLF